MSVIVKTRGIVLRSVRFSESSSIVTFFTEKAGKIAGMVRGARRAGNRFGSSLQPMSHVSVVIYRKPGREVQTVSQCELVESFRRIPAELERISIGMQFVELVNLLTHGEEENEEVYRLLSGSLRSVDSEPNPGRALLYHFEIEILRILGFRLDFEHCGHCGTPFGESFVANGKLRIDIRSGGPVCAGCAMAGGRYDLRPRGDYEALRTLSAGGWEPGRGDPVIGEDGAENLEAFLNGYFAYHIAGYRRLRSAEVFRKLIPPRGQQTAG
jgi:DNA repair protein RecO (recombination protein O)